MDVRDGIIEIKWLLLIRIDEVEGKLLHRVGKIFLVLKWHFLAIECVGFIAVLRIPVFAAAVKAQVLVESPVARLEGKLAPFAAHGRCIAGRLQDLGHHDFIGRLEKFAAVITCHAGVVGIPSRHEAGP